MKNAIYAIMTGLEIFYKPTSILGLLVAGGMLFLLIGGITMPSYPQVSDFFLKWGGILLAIGIVGWFFFIIPTIMRNWGKL